MPGPAIKIEALAATLGTSTNKIHRCVKAGKLPAPDVALWLKRPTGWRLSTLAQWNPSVARNLARAIKARAIPSY